MGDRGEERTLVLRERRVAVANEFADLPALPAQREPHRIGAGSPFRPGDVAVLEHERGTTCVNGLHGRLHDRFERLLEVQRLGDRFRDLREGLELRNAPLRLRIELGMLDCLRNLGGDRNDELDLVGRELPRVDRANVERTR